MIELTKINPAEIFAAVLKPYQQRIEKALPDQISKLGDKTALRDACEYGLMNGGKRFRPALVLMVAESLKSPIDVMQAALAVEFFHTASLVADDLPCMDDEEERRNQPALHKVYGEAVALLVSYALIAAGYENLTKNSALIAHSAVPYADKSDRICVLALENATFNTGLHGATGGQFLDVYPPDLSLTTLREVIHKKTVSLFEISFVLGWLYGGGKIESLDLVKKAASHFGMAFQIADDIGDMEQDLKNGRKINIANVCGLAQAKEMISEELEGYHQVLKKLKLEHTPFAELAKALIIQ